MPTKQLTSIKPNLGNYGKLYETFRWDDVRAQLSGLPNKKGFNIAYEAVDRHAEGPLKNTVALRWTHQDMTTDHYTYLDLKKLSCRFANILGVLGVKKGEFVFTYTGRIPELYIAALGTLKKSAVFCPLFSDLESDSVLSFLSQGTAKVLITTHSLFEKDIEHQMHLLPELQFVLITDIPKNISEKVISFSLLMKNALDDFEISSTKEDDAAFLHFTSGTSGKPKAVLHSHAAALTQYFTGKIVLDLRPGDVFWCSSDPGWMAGTAYGILSPLMNGATVLFDEEDFDALRCYAILEKQKVTVWYSSPANINQLMQNRNNPSAKYNLDNLRLVLSVGSPLYANVVEWGEKNLGLPILDNWWQTETGGIMIANYSSVKVKPGSMGKPLPGVESAIAMISDGEINIVKQPNVKGYLVIKKNIPSMFTQYLGDNDLFTNAFRDGWYITGDIAKKDENGYYWYIGREEDIIKTAGHMVGPLEVEGELMKHPAIEDVAVIGKPDALVGEIVKAFVVLKKGNNEDEEMKLDIMGFARKIIGSSIAPKEISFVDSLPKTKSGKLMRRVLKSRELGLSDGDVSMLNKYTDFKS
jgi:acetyl-CoA synthetase